MHEASIAQSILEVVSRQAEAGGYRKVTRIVIKVGYLSSVVPESLEFAFQALSRGTIAEGARLDIEEVPGEGRCRACGAVFPVDSFLCVCERCGTCDVEVKGGDDLTLESMDVEA